jgi:two-component system response regulator YesN
MVSCALLQKTQRDRVEEIYMFNTLVVEHNTRYRQILSDVLLLHFPSIEVDEAGDGREALSKVDYRRPNLIFMDIQLPEANGLYISKEIKRVYSDIVIVILTCNSLQEYCTEAHRYGVNYFISKEDDCCMENILNRVEAELAKLSHH